MTDVERLIHRGLELRCSIDGLKKQLEAVNREVAALAEFPEGKATAYVCGEGCRARVSLREYEKWDQERLGDARRLLGEELFGSLFRRVWEPVSRREVQGFLKHGPHELRAVVQAAREARVTPQVVYELNAGGVGE